MKNINFSKQYILFAIVLSISIVSVSSCKKQDNFLDVKSNKSDVTPKTLQDFQSILDNTQVMNGYGSILGLVGTDNIYIPDANLDGSAQTSRNSYLWLQDIYQGAIAFDWYYAYQEVEYANIVLDGLKSISNSEQPAIYNNIKGSALFYRAYAFYQLSQLYCKQFDSNSAAQDLGIPLRTSSDVNAKFTRATVKESYSQIINDLLAAEQLLPKVPLYKTRPSGPAADALLAKVYLSMSDYINGGIYADKALQVNASLLNYNNLVIGKANPFPTFQKGNPEVIFHAATYGLTEVIGASSVKARVDPALFESYENGDLRRAAFFVADGATGLYKFKGSYTATPYNFCGIANDELILIRAECSARTGNLSSSLSDLNKLLQNRYTPSTFVAFSTTARTELISKIITERRKEMPYTGNIRWDDLKRLNMETSYAKTLNRTSHGVLYTLNINDPRYIYPLPNDEIQLNKLIQNAR